MYSRSNREVYWLNAILVTKIYCYRCLIINNSAKKLYFSTKFEDRFSNLLDIKRTRYY